MKPCQMLFYRQMLLIELIKILKLNSTMELYPGKTLFVKLLKRKHSKQLKLLKHKDREPSTVFSGAPSRRTLQKHKKDS